MKKKLENLMYMFFGVLIALGGYFFGTSRNNNVEEQLDPANREYGEIHCSRLTIVNDEGKALVTLGSSVVGEGGNISVFGDGEVSVYSGSDILVQLRTRETGRAVYGLNGDNRRLHIKRAGAVSIYNNDGKKAIAGLTAGQTGGDIFVADEDGNERVTLGVNFQGGGYVSASYGDFLDSSNELLTGGDGDFGSVSLTARRRGGYVDISSIEGIKAVLDNDQYGGRLTIFNRDYKNVVQACANSAGNGTVIAWDPFGDVIGGLMDDKGKIDKRLNLGQNK